MDDGKEVKREGREGGRQQEGREALAGRGGLGMRERATGKETER